MDSLEGYDTPEDIVEWAKVQFDIQKSSEDLTDAEIGQVVRWIGMTSFDSIILGEKIVIRRFGIDLMLLITLTVFPEFYEKHRLSQWN